MSQLRHRTPAAPCVNENLPTIRVFPDPRGIASLNERERTILGMLVSDLSEKQVAARLSISRKTVDCHTYRIRRKLGVHTTRAAVLVLVGALDLPNGKAVQA